MRDVVYMPQKRRRFSAPFGTELEVVFDDNYSDDYDRDYENYDEERGGEEAIPEYIFGGRYAPEAPFYSDWHSIGDGSLPDSGCELVSPILRGAGGVAEVIRTMELLKDEGGRVTSLCGTHITLTAAHSTARLNALRLMTVLEEAAFASTGAYKRYASENYCSPVKRRYSDSLRGGHSFNTEKYTAVHDKHRSGALEFRYPAGTLNADQFVLNLGICQLIVRLATGLKPGIISRLVNQTLPFHDAIQDRRSVPAWHYYTLYGLAILADQGWIRNGSFNGVPYNPRAKDLSIDIADHGRDTYETVDLPSSKSLFARYRRQIGHFYDRAETYHSDIYGHRHYDYPWAEMRAESLSIVEGTPTIEATARLSTIMRGYEDMVLPSASRLPTTSKEVLLSVG